MEMDEPGAEAAVAHGAARFGPFTFDRENGLLYRDGIELNAPPRVLAILDHLLEQPGRVIHKRALIKAVWKDSFVTDTSLTEAMSLLRQTLGDDPQHPTYIQTVHRRGYRFVAQISFQASPTSPLVTRSAAYVPDVAMSSGADSQPQTPATPAIVLDPPPDAPAPQPSSIAESAAVLEESRQRPRATVSSPSGAAMWTSSAAFWVGIGIGFTVGALSATVVSQLVQ